MDRDMDPGRPNSEWFATVRRWLAERGELLLSYTLAGAAGSGGYAFFSSQRAIDEFLSALPTATRVYVYRKHALSIRGVVNEEFSHKLRAHMPKRGDFLLVSMEEIEYSHGYVGYLGDTLEELDEILSDTNGEHVAFGPSPVADKDTERIVAYIDGIVGAY